MFGGWRTRIFGLNGFDLDKSTKGSSGNHGTRPRQGKIKDKDGGFSEYSAEVTVQPLVDRTGSP
jgi:hypothetical protein